MGGIRVRGGGGMMYSNWTYPVHETSISPLEGHSQEQRMVARAGSWGRREKGGGRDGWMEREKEEGREGGGGHTRCNQQGSNLYISELTSDAWLHPNLGVC